MAEKDRYEEEGISLRELILVLLKGKKTIAWVTVFVFLITMIGGTISPKINIGSDGLVQTAVQLYFSGIEVGKTPNGEIYNVNEIKSTEVIQNALNSIDFGKKHVSAEMVKNSISIQAVVPDNVAKTLDILSDVENDQIRVEKLENLTGYSDIYIIRLNLIKPLGLGQEEGRLILDSIVAEYKKQLIGEYGDNAVLADVFADDFDISKYDYIQAADILNNQLTRMETYVQGYMPQTNVDSTVTGLNPADITSALQSMRSVDMERIYTMIATFFLTKQPDRIVAVYEQLAEEKEKEAAQYYEEAASVKNTILTFKKDEQKIILGDTNSAPLNLTSENGQYNKFVSQYIAAGAGAVDAAEDAKYYRTEAERFKQPLTPSTVNSEKAAEVEKNIQLLQEKLVYWTKTINDTAEDYNSEATYQHYAEQLMPARAYAGLETGPNNLMLAAIGVFVGLFLGILTVLFRAYMKDEISGSGRRRDNNETE